MGLDEEENRVVNSIPGWEFPNLSFLLETEKRERGVWTMKEKGASMEEQKFKETCEKKRQT